MSCVFCVTVAANFAPHLLDKNAPLLTITDERKLEYKRSLRELLYISAPSSVQCSL